MRLSIILGCLLLIVGCSTHKDTQSFHHVTSLDEDEGGIYLFFPGEGITRGPDLFSFGPSLYINGEKLGMLEIETYVPLVLPAGNHTIRTTSNWNHKAFPDLNVSVGIKPGEAKYLQYIWTGKSLDQQSNLWISRYLEVKETEAIGKLGCCALNSKLTKAASKLR